MLCTLSFKAISQVVLEKEIFKSFCIYGHKGHLGHVNRSITAKPQWLEHVRNKEKMFETGEFRANEC